jgi:hypothetical protein
MLAAAAVVGMVAPTVAADPTPMPSPGYQIPGPNGPEFPGAQAYPKGASTPCWPAGSGTTLVLELGTREETSKPVSHTARHPPWVAAFHCGNQAVGGWISRDP